MYVNNFASFFRYLVSLSRVGNLNVRLRGCTYSIERLLWEFGWASATFQEGVKRRICGISELADQLGKQVPEGIPKQDACEALIGLSSLTGCDTVSAFASKGKWRPVQMVVKN